MGVCGLTLVLSLASVGITTTDDCPSRAAIEAHLETLAPMPSTNQATVTRTATSLRVELRDAGGTVLASRTLEPRGDCAELAEVAATVIAAWETDLHERLSVLPPTPPAPPTAPRAAWEVSASGLVSFAERWAAGGRFDVSVAPGGGRWSGVLSLAGLTTREVTVSPGVASWWWAAASLGARVELWRGWARLDAEAFGTMSWLNVEGRGFSELAPPFQVVVPGVMVGLRGSKAFGPVSLVLGVDGLAWLSSQTLRVGRAEAPTETLSERKLPLFELLMTVGLAVGGS